ncbi:MAG: hypothetical protein KBF71_08075, partial [Alphaproteobacteria bacterium]|nr:hypothetical protein [Alphaproteobacteria bacterium]
MKQITKTHFAIPTGSTENSSRLSCDFTSDIGVRPRVHNFTENQQLLSQVLFQVPVQDLYQRLCHADVEKKKWVLSVLREYADVPCADAFVRFALGPHRKGSFYFDTEQDELIAHIKNAEDVSETFQFYQSATSLNLYYEGTDIRPFIQILDQMKSLKKMTVYFAHFPLMNHFRPGHLIFTEKFSGMEKISFSNDLTLKQMLDALTLFPHAREVNVSASHQAFETLSQEDALCLKELLSSQLEKLAIPHDVSSSVLRML